MGPTLSTAEMTEREAASAPSLAPRPTIDEIIDLVVRCHTAAQSIRDPSPTCLFRNARGQLAIDGADLEHRTIVNIPHLALHELWALMSGCGTEARLVAGRRYLERRGLSSDVDEALRIHRGKETERCFHDNRDFKIVQSGDLIWHCRRDLLRPTHDPILADPDRFLRPGSKLLKDGRATTISVVPGQALLKRFNSKKLRALFKHHFMYSRARHSFQGAYHLEMLGISTPRPVAFAERRFCGLLLRSYLLMEYLPDAMAIDRFTRQWQVDGTPARKIAVENVGRIVGQLHEAGFANRDLKSRNILVSEAGQAWIIDLDGVDYKSRVNEETRVRNLLRMVRDLEHHGRLTLRDRLSFLKSYARAAGAGSANGLFRRLAEAVREKGAK